MEEGRKNRHGQIKMKSKEGGNPINKKIRAHDPKGLKMGGK